MCTLLDQRRRRWADVGQMLYKWGGGIVRIWRRLIWTSKVGPRTEIIKQLIMAVDP